jgi:acetyl esterase/lipase
MSLIKRIPRHLLLKVLPLILYVYTAFVSAQVQVENDGTVLIPAQAVPVSEFLSAEGKNYLVEHLLGLKNPDSFILVDGVPALIAGYLERQRELFAVSKIDTTIGGVHAIVYEPVAGIAPENSDRILINLHGGGFAGCWLGCAELESLPIAALGRIKVVSLDYRQGPEHRFPAASEDVAAAYRELLDTYAPENIGIYGSSAGGMLAAQAVAWFQQHDLPRPGAIALLNAGAAPTGAAFGGDAGYFTMPLGEGRVMPPPQSPPAGIGGGANGYFADVALDDPLVAPTTDLDILSNFPPTLILSGTRSYDLSNAVHTHMQLVKQDVPAQLYVWEGMFHGFFYNAEVPESREAFTIINKFFDRWLGVK